MQRIQIGQVWKTESGRQVTINRIGGYPNEDIRSTGIAYFKWGAGVEKGVWIGGDYNGKGGPGSYDYDLVQLLSGPGVYQQIQLRLFEVAT